MKAYTFRVVIEADPFEDGRMAYHAYCPALKGCHTWGYTKEEAIKNIQEAVRGHIEALLKLGLEIPTEPECEVQVSSKPLVTVIV